MSNKFVLLFLTFIASTSVAAPIDSLVKLPPARWDRTRKIDVKHIALDLQFDWTTRQAYGIASITLGFLRPTDHILLDAAHMKIKDVKLGEQKLTFQYYGGESDENLKIKLPRSFTPQETIMLSVDYRTQWINETDPANIWGSNGKGIRFFEPSSSDQRRKRQIWSMAEFQSARYWFPGYDAPNDLRTTEFRATVDKNFTVISNGVLVDTRNNNNGTRTFLWKMDTPYANHQTAFVVGEYVDVPQSAAATPLHNYSYPDEVDATAASVACLPDMVKYFTELTGVSYPYPSYGQVFVQELPWGMENITFSTQSENMVDDYPTHADYLYLWDALEAEALARSWFGGYVAAKDWSHIWLNRSFSLYFDRLFNEYKNGRDEFLLYSYAFDHSTWLNDWNAGVRHPIVTRHYDNVHAFATDNYSYTRGALVLHMLRKQLGEEKWRASIRHYLASNAHQLVDTEDFREAIEEATGENLEWFFDQWIYKMGHPVFEVSKMYDAEKKQLQLVVRQVQKPDTSSAYPQAEFFQGNMELQIDDKTETIWIESAAETTYTFAASSEPKLVYFDVENTWIKELTFKKTESELLYQFENSNDVLARRSALLELVKIAKADTTSAESKEKILLAFRNVIQSNAYWRLRSLTLSQLQGILAPSTETKPVSLDETTVAMLLGRIEKDKSWVQFGAINFLGMTRDPKYADVYLKHLYDSSDRVVYGAAIALGRSKSPKAFDALVKLKSRPSWKNQSLISCLFGLKELGDPRGYDVAFKALSDVRSARWTLLTPLWDFQIEAAETIHRLGKADKAYSYILKRFNQSMLENNINDMFTNGFLIATLADARGLEALDELMKKFKTDANASAVVEQYKTMLKGRIGK